jgi:uncharacterized membrane-anchored protein
MKAKIIMVLMLSIGTACFAQNEEQFISEEFEVKDSLIQMFNQIDSIEKSLNYQTGMIGLTGANATLNVPPGFGYLDPMQAKKVLEEYWGNPPAETLGLLVPDSGGVLQEGSWVFELTYDAIGFVEDGDAQDINYDDLLVEMKKDVDAENKMRSEQGYPTVDLIGWASPPYYDTENKVLHWAKDFRFQEMDVNTLNYNVRILGRKGVLVVNAIASTPQLELIKGTIPAIMNHVKFDNGFQYADFDSNVDEVAAYTIGGLVAGKVLAKAGLFAVLAKFGKLIFIGIAAAGAGIWRWFRGRKKEKEIVALEEGSNSQV